MMEFGSLRILGARVSFGDMSIFDHLKLADRPALLVGMDVLGQLGSMVIDYGRNTVRLRPVSWSRFR